MTRFKRREFKALVRMQMATKALKKKAVGYTPPKRAGKSCTARAHDAQHATITSQMILGLTPDLLLWQRPTRQRAPPSSPKRSLQSGA
eukprot:7383446-Prymnesium_polylepis.5